MNKDEARAKFGEEQVHIWRRSKCPSSKRRKFENTMTEMPYFKEKIFNQLEGGKNILIAAHGNSLRSLVKYSKHL